MSPRAEALFMAIETLLADLRAEVAVVQPAGPEPAPGCPFCGEVEKLEDTTDAEGKRTTCLSTTCGKSWRPDRG